MNTKYKKSSKVFTIIFSSFLLICLLVGSNIAFDKYSGSEKRILNNFIKNEYSDDVLKIYECCDTLYVCDKWQYQMDSVQLAYFNACCNINACNQYIKSNLPITVNTDEYQLELIRKRNDDEQHNASLLLNRFEYLKTCEYQNDSTKLFLIYKVLTDHQLMFVSIDQKRNAQRVYKHEMKEGEYHWTRAIEEYNLKVSIFK